MEPWTSKRYLDVDTDPERVECEQCSQCGGTGYVIFPAHANDDSCRQGECANCPVPEQDVCDECGGYGFFTQPADNKTTNPKPETQQKSISDGEGTG